MLEKKRENLKKIINLNSGDKNKEEMCKLQEEAIIYADEILSEQEKNNKPCFVMIADDVGLGKTYEGLGLVFLELDRSEKKRKNILIIAPNKQIADKWINTYNRFKIHCYKNTDTLNKKLIPEITDYTDNPLQLVNIQDDNENHVSVIRSNKFSYIKNVTGIEDREQIFIKLKEENEKLTEFDLVIIDESQNLRREESDKNINFNCFFGLERKFASLEKYNNYAKIKEAKNKFKKVVFLSATPNHREKQDINRQLEYVLSKETVNEIMNDTENGMNIITNEHDFGKFEKEKNNKKDKLYIIRRIRTFNNKNKYYFRKFSADESEMDFKEMLIMSVIQKKYIAEKDRYLVMGGIDGFESFRPASQKQCNEKENNQENEYFSEELIENIDRIEKNKKVHEIGNIVKKIRNTFFLENLITSLKELGLNEDYIINDFLSHPKVRKIREITRNKDITKPEKHLIFVRRIDSTRELQRELIKEYDEEIKKLVLEKLVSFEKKKNINQKEEKVENVIQDLEKYLTIKDEKETKYFYKMDNEQDEYEDEDENNNNKEIQSKWLNQIKRNPKGNQTQMYLKKTRFWHNEVLADFWEEDIIEKLGYSRKIINNEIHINIKNNPSRIARISLDDINMKLSKLFKDKFVYKDRKTDLKRVVTILELEKILEQEDKESLVYKNVINIKNAYEKIYFSNIIQRDVIEDKINGQEDLILKFLKKIINKKTKNIENNFWDLKEIKNTKILDVFDKEIITEKDIYKREVIKDIIKGNIIAGEGIIYILVVFAEILYKKKIKKITDPKILLKEIAKDKSSFKKRVFNRIISFIDTIDDEMEILTIDFEGYFKSKTKLITDLPIKACSSEDSKKLNKLQKCFNTSFFPDILISTDILKEGIDLQVQCSNIINYGIAWLPGDMEQRIGRIDRFLSKTYRDYKKLKSNEKDKAKVNIKFVYMKNSLDEKQVARILERMIESIGIFKNSEKFLIQDGVEKGNEETDVSDEKEEISRYIDLINKIDE